MDARINPPAESATAKDTEGIFHKEGITAVSELVFNLPQKVS
ncbi:MAG: hypothetical protein ACE5R6_07440 [Candidatus Heimdallarchaeota archaeon]